MIRVRSTKVAQTTSVRAVSSDSYRYGMMLIGCVVIRVRLVNSIFRGSRLNGFSAEWVA